MKWLSWMKKPEWFHHPPMPRYAGTETLLKSMLTPDHWILTDHRRDWGQLRVFDGRWHAMVYPGNGKHESLGWFDTADEAKTAVEQRLFA